MASNKDQHSPIHETMEKSLACIFQGQSSAIGGSGCLGYSEVHLPHTSSSPGSPQLSRYHQCWNVLSSPYSQLCSFYSQCSNRAGPVTGVTLASDSLFFIETLYITQQYNVFTLTALFTPCGGNMMYTHKQNTIQTKLRLKHVNQMGRKNKKTIGQE